MLYLADVQHFKITTKRSDDSVEAKAEHDKSVFVIRSPFGISHATIERTTEQWPDEVVLQLRLSALESFKASTGGLKLEASVLSHDGTVRLWKDGKQDSPLDSMNPYWMEIRILNDDGKPTKAMPLTDGYFEMQLPKMFFEGNPKAFQLKTSIEIDGREESRQRFNWGVNTSVLQNSAQRCGQSLLIPSSNFSDKWDGSFPIEV